MGALGSIAVAVIAWLGKTLGVKLGLLAVALATTTALILGTRLAFEALLAGLGAVVPLPPAVASVAVALAPANLDDAVLALVNAYVLRLVFIAQWVYVKLYITSASWKVL